MPDGSKKPVGYTSHTLTPTERNYSQIEKEGLACVYGVKKFHAYLYGHHFILVADHKFLLAMFKETQGIPPQASGQIQQWDLTLSAYEYTLVFRTTAQHGNADALSRLSLPDQPKETPQPAETIYLMQHLEKSPVTSTHIKAWTRRDPLLSRVVSIHRKDGQTTAVTQS